MYLLCVSIKPFHSHSHSHIISFVYIIFVAKLNVYYAQFTLNRRGRDLDSSVVTHWMIVYKLSKLNRVNRVNDIIRRMDETIDENLSIYSGTTCEDINSSSCDSDDMSSVSNSDDEAESSILASQPIKSYDR